MRAIVAGLALAVLAVGCEAKPEPTTGREFLDKFQRAEKAKDTEAIWSLLSKESRDALIASAKAPEPEKKDETAKPDADAEKKAKERLAKQLEEKPSVLRDATYVEERADGDRVILVIEVAGQKKEIPLGREKESLVVKWDVKNGI